MNNSKKTTAKATEKPEKKTVDVELDDKALEAVSGGVIGGDGGCTSPRSPKWPSNGGLPSF